MHPHQLVHQAPSQPQHQAPLHTQARPEPGAVAVAGRAAVAGSHAAMPRRRECAKCGVTETPNWRCNGTLCNACGLKAQRGAGLQPGTSKSSSTGGGNRPGHAAKRSSGAAGEGQLLTKWADTGRREGRWEEEGGDEAEVMVGYGEYERIPKPRGRPQKGKEWDDRSGCWVAETGTVPASIPGIPVHPALTSPPSPLAPPSALTRDVVAGIEEMD